MLGVILRGLERGGAALAEVGFPYSDPIADGPTIAAAMHEALSRGTTVASVMEEVRVARAKGMVSGRFGLVAMASVSLVRRAGKDAAGDSVFMARAKASGFDAVLLPDVPLEEAVPYRQAADRAGLTFPMLVSPTTPPARIAEIVGVATGFVYVLARTGITGEQADAPQVAGIAGRVRQATTLPIVCGFGISTPSHARAASAHVDGVIVGSAVVRRLAAAAGSGRDAMGAVEAEAEAMAREFCDAMPAKAPVVAAAGAAPAGAAPAGAAAVVAPVGGAAGGGAA